MSLLKNIFSSTWKLRWLIVLIVVIGVLFGVINLFRLLTTQGDGIPVEIKEKAKSSEFKNYGQAIILNSTSFVIIPVVLDANSLEKVNSFKESYYENSGMVVNYFFINKNKDEKRKLFESDVQILSSNLQPDNSGNYSVENISQSKILIYKVVNKDTNNDKLLSDKDYSSLYISNLIGQNLKIVTPQNRYVDYYIEDEKVSRIVIGLHDDKKQQQVMIFDYKTGKSILYNL